MINTRVRTVVAGTAAALLLSPLAACGADDQEAAASSSSVSPSESAEASTSESPEQSATVEDAAEDGEASGEAIDAENFAETMAAAIEQQETAHISLEMGGEVGAEGDVRYGDDGTQMQMTMSMGRQEAELIIVEDALYLQMPGMGPRGKWVKVSKDDPMLGEMLGQMDAMGPSGALEAMKNGLEDVRLVGEEDVDGETLKHYVVTVDTQAAIDSLGQLGEEAGQKGDLPPEMTYDLYLDEENLMRRLVLDAGGEELVMEVSGWGEDVEIEAPPASEVVDMPSRRGTS